MPSGGQGVDILNDYLGLVKADLSETFDRKAVRGLQLSGCVIRVLVIFSFEEDSACLADGPPWQPKGFKLRHE